MSTWARRKTRTSTLVVITTDAGQQKAESNKYHLFWAGDKPGYAGCDFYQITRKKRNETILFVPCNICLFLLCHKELRPARFYRGRSTCIKLIPGVGI